MVANFSVVANAGEVENLVDSNMSNWVDYSDITPVATDISVTYSSSSNVNILSIPSTDTVSLLYDLTDFINVGEKYVFRCFFPNTGGINANSFGNCDLTIGLVYIDDDGSVLGSVDDIEFNITYSNYSSFDNDYFELSFEIAKSVKNTAISFCFTPIFSDGMPSSQFYVSNVELVRVESETEKKLDGILGWLESIWDSITSLDDKLTDVWTNITSSVSALGDRISGFFTDLGDRISGFFENLITNVKTFFEELPKKIFNYEIEVTDDDIISDGGGSDGEVEDEEDIEKIPIDYNLFKDGSLKDLKVINGSTMYIEKPSYYTSGELALNLYGYKYDGSKFTCPAENDLIITFDVSSFSSDANCSWTCSLLSNYNRVSCDITGNGSYTLTLPSAPVETGVCILFNCVDTAPYSQTFFNVNGLSYYLSTPNGDGSSGDTGSDEEGTTTKVSWFQYLINKFKSWFNSIIDSVKGFFIKLVDDIKGLFIPPEGFFEEWKVTFDLMLSDNLGFIYQAPNFVIDIVEVVQEILQSDREVNLVFPAVEFDIAGYHIELFKDTKVDFSFLEAGIWLTLYSMYKVMLYVIFALALIKYGMSTWERTMAN